MTPVWLFLYSGDRYSKNCIVKTCETLIVWRTFCYTAGSGKSDAIEGVPDKLLKGAARVYRVHRDMTNCCWPTDVYSQRWLSILRQLYVIIKRHAQINWYFQCSVVSLTLCKEYWNTAEFRISFLLLIKSWTFWYIDCLPKSLYKKVIHFKKWSSFFGPPCTIAMLDDWGCQEPMIVASWHSYTGYCAEAIHCLVNRNSQLKFNTGIYPLSV